jgi:antitoxin CptB
MNSESDSDIETWRKRLRFRAWHRGMREVDLILGRFADARLAGLDVAGLAAFEAVLEQPDPEILGWITGEFAVPAEYDTPLMREIAAFGRAGLGARGGGG